MENNVNKAQKHHDSCCPNKTSEKMKFNKKRLKRLGSFESFRNKGIEISEMTSKKKYLYFYIVLCLGDTNVGKTCLINK